MKKKLRFLAALLLLPGLLFAAEPYYDSGSQIFNITAGVTVPFFYNDPNNEDDIYWTFGPGSSDDGHTNSTVGGVGAISYQVFVNPYLAIGGELGFQFDFQAKSKTVATNVPIFAKLTTVPVQGRFEVPISLGAGLVYSSYRGSSKLTFGCSVEAGVRYFITDEWGLGINVGFLFIPELYTSNTAKISTLSYIPATLTVSYRH